MIKTENTTRTNEEHSIMVKETIHPGDIDIIIVDTPNKRALKSIKQN